MDRLHLTIGGRVAFTLVAAIGTLAVIGDAVSESTHGDQGGGVLAIFVVIVLGVVVGLDSAFRVVHRGVTRSATTVSSPKNDRLTIRSSPQALALSVRLCELVDVTPPEDELAYLNVADVARVVCERSITDANSLQPLFDVGEEVLETGDMELRTLIAVGLFEDLQNSLRRGSGSQEAILGMLGPRSRRAWAGVEAFRKGGPKKTITQALSDQ
jgi:hypothetical protein